MKNIPGPTKRFTALFLMLAATSHASIVVAADRDTQDVKHVLDAFHDAVYTNDGNRLAALFIPEGSAWVSVLTDSSYGKLKGEHPGVSQIKVGNYRDFVKAVNASQGTFRPTRSNLVIHTDGSVASVYFDYVFVIGGMAQNRGHETWQLVKGENGWRIAAIAYSSTPQPH